jgi:hypothetical protein
VSRLSAPVRAALLRLLADDLPSDQLHDQPPVDDQTLQAALVSLGEQPEVRPRVVITGLGALTPLGSTAPSSWKAMVAGRSGVGRVTLFDASAYPCQIAAEIKGFDPIAAGVPPKDARRMARCSQITLAAGAEIRMAVRPVSLARALSNLIDNALRYGGRARVSLIRDGAEVVFRVEDAGPGIPEARLGDVVEPFVRGEESRSAETGGTGLGLAITRNIALAHGGALRLQNLPQGGLCAELRLPAGA